VRRYLELAAEKSSGVCLSGAEKSRIEMRDARFGIGAVKGSERQKIADSRYEQEKLKTADTRLERGKG